MKSLKEYLTELLANWELIPIRVKEDGRWKSLFLSEIKDGNQILDWVKSTKGRHWE